MAQSDEVRALHTKILEKLDSQDLVISELSSDISDLIDLLKALPPTEDLTDVIASAQAISDKIDTITSEVSAEHEKADAASKPK